MMASEVVSSEATPAASVSAVRTTLRGSMIPAFTRSSNTSAIHKETYVLSRPCFAMSYTIPLICHTVYGTYAMSPGRYDVSAVHTTLCESMIPAFTKTSD